MPASSPSERPNSKLRPAAIAAFLAVLGRIVVAPILLFVFTLSTNYLSTASVFITSDESYFAYSQQDAVMVGGCTGRSIGCRKTFMQLLAFQGVALLNKPDFEHLYSTTMEFNDSILTDEMLRVADAIDDDPIATCMSGVDEWGSLITTIAGDPQYAVDIVRLLDIPVPPQTLREVQEAVETRDSCPSRWLTEVILRLFKFQSASNSGEYSSIAATDFAIFPEFTECRRAVSDDGGVGSKLALQTEGRDLLAVAPAFMTLFPYSFKSSLKQGTREIKTTEPTKYNAASVTQPLVQGYYGARRVREVNATGVFIENSCTIDPHWENYGLMLQAPDDIPVCTTSDVCVHNYYNSRWEYAMGKDSSQPDRFWMALNVFRSRYANSVAISVLPCVVVIQILLTGVISLYQTMSKKRSVLLTQIWAYRCQNGLMQSVYLAQITYHLAHSSDVYYLGLTTSTLSLESVGNLTLCFYAFSYCQTRGFRPRRVRVPACQSIEGSHPAAGCTGFIEISAGNMASDVLTKRNDTQINIDTCLQFACRT